MRAALVLAVLLLAAPAHAASWKCVLWPHSCPAPAPVQIPVPEPPAAAVVPYQAAPPVAPVADPVPKAKRAARPSRCLERMQAEVKQRRTILTNAQRQACFRKR